MSRPGSSPGLRSQAPPRPGSWAIIPLAFAALLAVVVVPIVLFRDRAAEEPQPTPSPEVVAVAGEIRTVPQLSPERKNDLIRELGRVLVTLYERAFVAAAPAATPYPSPSATPSTPAEPLFTERARRALRKDPDAFQRVETLRVGQGRVEFGGIATLEGSKPVQALLQVDFTATGLPEGRTAPEVKVRQVGSLLLIATPNGWRVDGFDLDFSTRPEPTPTG